MVEIVDWFIRGLPVLVLLPRVISQLFDKVEGFLRDMNLPPLHP